MDALLPASLRALAAHLGTEAEPNPAAWRAALRLLELRYGPAPAEPEGLVVPVAAEDLAGMTWQQMQSLAASLLVVESAITANVTTVEPP